MLGGTDYRCISITGTHLFILPSYLFTQKSESRKTNTSETKEQAASLGEILLLVVKASIYLRDLPK